MSYRSQFVAELSVSLVSLGIPLSPVANSVAGAGDWNSRHSGGGQGGVWVVRFSLLLVQGFSERGVLHCPVFLCWSPMYTGGVTLISWCSGALLIKYTA